MATKLTCQTDTGREVVSPAYSHTFRCIAQSNEAALTARDVASEMPVAIEVNGIGYAVLMASPIDLADLLFGFLRTEWMIEAASEILAFDIFALDAGVIARATVASQGSDLLVDRIRHRTSDSSCGLCGVENLEQAMREMPRVAEKSLADDRAVFRALEALPSHQPLNRSTGAVHAAAICSARGDIVLVREDIGRHNALDKVIGAMARKGMTWDGGFALLSSRCSYDLVEKAAIAGCPLLVTISAPTRLALDRAAQAGLDLRVLARTDGILSPAHLTDDQAVIPMIVEPSPDYESGVIEARTPVANGTYRFTGH